MCPGLPQKSVTFHTCFHDLADGSQIHSYAPMGLDIKQKWSVGGNAHGELVQPTEIGIGAPVSGLYIREDIELKCNFLAVRLVRRSLKDAIEVLIARLLAKAQLMEAAKHNKKVDNAQSNEYKIPLSPKKSSLKTPMNQILSPPGSPHVGKDDSDLRFTRNLVGHENHLITLQNNANAVPGQKEHNWTEGSHQPEKMMPVELPS